MLKTLKDKWPLVALIGISGLSVGMVVAVLKTTDAFQPAASVTTAPGSNRDLPPSAILGLANQPPETRSEALTALAQKAIEKSDDSLESNRARYLLAADLIDRGQPNSALAALDDLERSYAALAPHVLLKKGQAQLSAGQPDLAIATWTALGDRHRDSPATAEALYQLGRQPAAAPDAWNQLLQDFPNHPRSVEVALEQLAASAQPAQSPSAQSPAAKPAAPSESSVDRAALLRLVARYGVNHPDYVAHLDRLTEQYSSTLSPEDWAAVGFGYWETQNYGQAGEAYAKAPSTPTSLYRAARGRERGGKIQAAIAGYQQLNLAFPDTPEAATGLLKLANLQSKQAALGTLDQVIARFPNRAAEALATRADLLEALKSPDSAKQARASILSQYPDSDAAAEIRFKQARAHAKTGNFAGAIQWAKQLVDDAPNAELAPEAGFWLAKWSLRQNQPDIARQAFEKVIADHPESYFAWRSAVHLDWDVGDFDTVRTYRPEVALPAQRSPLPAGSPALQELYLLGRDSEAWTQWQAEFSNVQSPTVAEQFTDGILRLGVGDNLNGIFMVSSLAWREDPAEQREYALLEETPAYWQAIYPFPFAQLIEGWADRRQLNPLLVTALVRQESRFQPQIQSVVGAVGLMQVMPETGEWISQQLGQADYSLSQPEDNVKFGTWYLDYTHREYTNNSLFAVASYNAGPGSVSEWIARGDFTNADEFVEKIPYPETKGYVEKVFGGYWNYLRLYNPDIAAKMAKL